MVNNDENIKIEIQEIVNEIQQVEKEIEKIEKEIEKEQKADLKRPLEQNSETNIDTQPNKVQINKSRCMSCNKKIGLLGFKCKCEYLFCSQHRYSDRHDCTFDYKELGKELLNKANPVVISSKIDKI
jgi:Mg2+ and Co2+ transporter CorA